MNDKPGVFPPHSPDRMPDHVTLNDIWRLLHDHIQQEHLWRQDIEQAFPVNERTGKRDFNGHGVYHERLMERAIKAELAKERLLERVIGGSLWALLAFLGIAALAYLKDHVFK